MKKNTSSRAPASLHTMARPGADGNVGLVYATVTGRADKWFFLSSADPTLERAVRADSCLIEPDCGDTVLACNGGAASYILAVLTRATPGQAALMLPGGVSMHTDEGKFSVQAEEMNLSARSNLSMQAPQIALTGINGEVRFQRLNTTAQQVRAHFGAVHTMAQSVTSTVGRLVQRVRDSFRWTDNLDETRAGRMRVQVSDRYDLKAKHATVRAEGQVRIDGDKIDLG